MCKIYQNVVELWKERTEELIFKQLFLTKRKFKKKMNLSAGEVCKYFPNDIKYVPSMNDIIKLCNVFKIKTEISFIIDNNSSDLFMIEINPNTKNLDIAKSLFKQIEQYHGNIKVLNAETALLLDDVIKTFCKYLDKEFGGKIEEILITHTQIVEKKERKNKYNKFKIPSDLKFTTVSDVVKYLISKSGKSQADIGFGLGKSRAYASQIMAVNNTNGLRKICEFLGYNYDTDIIQIDNYFTLNDKSDVVEKVPSPIIKKCKENIFETLLKNKQEIGINQECTICCNVSNVVISIEIDNNNNFFCDKCLDSILNKFTKSKNILQEFQTKLI